MYEAWSIGYERYLISGQGCNADEVLQPIVDLRQVQPAKVHQGVTSPAVPPPAPVVPQTPPVYSNMAL
jgi:hypothetical protein